MSQLRQATLLLAALLALSALPAGAQLVNDGTTNVLSNATNIVMVGVTGVAVGTNGSQAAYLITNGALLRLIGDAFIGRNAGSFSNRVVIAGAGSRWLFDTMGDLSVGAAGWGNQLVISDGGRMSQTAGFAYIGRDSTASNNEIVVRGSGSSFGSLASVVGYAGSGNRLTIEDGGVVQNQQVHVGYLAGSSGNVLSVSGTNSQLNAIAVQVGSSGSDNQMILSNGGFVSSAFGYLGAETNADRNQAVITGSGTVWSNFGTLYVGHAGAGNSLLVADNGIVSTTNLVLGHLATSTNNRVQIEGGVLLVTNAARSGTLDLRRGTNLLNSGYLEVDNLVMTNAAGRFVFNGGTLITRGATIDNGQSFVVGANASYEPATWDVRSNSTFTTLDGRLYIGSNTSSAKLLITNGGSLVNSNAYLGFSATASNNSAVISGAGSVWTNYGILRVGDSGSGNALLVANGGLIQSSSGVIGFDSTAVENVTVVAGAGSVWSNGGSFYVGFSGAANLLLVSNGATLQNSSGTLGHFDTASNNLAIVTGAGSAWISGTLRVGTGGAGNTLLITNGGLVNGFSSLIGFSSDNNLVAVTGPGSVWSNSSYVIVGNYGASNTLIIANGGIVRNATGYIGANSYAGGVTLANNNRVVVTDPNSLWTNRQSLYVGDAGQGNTLLITNGGTVAVGSNIFVGYESTATGNSLIVAGGYLRATNAGTVLDVRRGTTLLSSGLIEVNQLVMTNAIGVFEFHEGLLRTKGTTNSNGRTFGIGNGTRAATFQLLGGAHVFANDLLVTSTATVSGNGTIIGNVTNFGSIAPGNSAGAITIHGDLRLRDSASMVFEIGGLIPTNQHDVVNVTNFVEFAGTLSLSLLPGFLPAVADSFALMSFASSSGAFANVSGGRVSLTNNLASFAVTQTATNLLLSGVQYADTDGDGQGDLQEQAAGTDANDSTSVLGITAITVNGSGHNVVTFQTVPAQTYRIEYSSNLVAWPIATTNVPSAGTSTEWTDDGSLTGGLPTGPRFYRVGLQ